LWIITAWQCISPEVALKGVKNCCIYPVQWMGLMMVCGGMAVKRMGMLGVSVRKMKALIGDRDSDSEW
jgi:hypothetical protein